MNDRRQAKCIPDRAIVRTLWPVLMAAVIGLFPFTVFSTFLVPIAAEAGVDAASVGALRGLGGVAALVVGVAFAPLVSRFAHHHAGAAGLAVLAAAAMTGTAGNYPALVVFCLVTGAGTAILTPALLATAADRFPDDATAGRAATMVTACTSLAAVLAGPVIGVLAGWRGWQGALGVTAMCALGICGGLLAWPPTRTSENGSSAGWPGYLASFRALRGTGLVAVIVVAALRTAAFMGYLAYLAVVFDQRFGLDARMFTLVWTLSGASFFAGNYVAGRWVNAADADPARPSRLIVAGLVVALGAVVAVFHAPVLALALTATVMMGLSHAAVAASVTTVIVRSSGTARGAALSINAAGMSVGVFVGAALGGIGLAAHGHTGVALALGALTVAALAAAVTRTATWRRRGV